VERLVGERLGTVVVVDNLRRGRKENLSACWNRIAFVQADIRDPDALTEVMTGVDVVFHLAAQSNVMDAVHDIEYSFGTNVLGTLHVLQAARRAGVRRLVFASSREVYGDAEDCPVSETAPLRPKNAYGASKVAGEAYCSAFQGQLETVILRLANVYGSRDRQRVIPLFAENALRNQPLLLYGERRVVDFIWVGAALDAFIKAGFGRWIDEPLNVASGRGTDLHDLARRILSLTQSTSPLRVEPARAAEVSRFVADPAKANRLLGLEHHPDPLFRLADVVEWKRREFFNGELPCREGSTAAPKVA